jgi:hypothetical protein
MTATTDGRPGRLGSDVERDGVDGAAGRGARRPGRLSVRGAELLIAREWAILAGENDYTTGTFQQITGRPPRRSPSSFTGTARNSSDARVSTLT